MSVSPTGTINLLQTSSTSSTDPILPFVLRLSLFAGSTVFSRTFPKNACRFRGSLRRLNYKIVGRCSEIAFTVTKSLWLILKPHARSCLCPCSCFPTCSSSSSLSFSRPLILSLMLRLRLRLIPLSQHQPISLQVPFNLMLHITQHHT